MTAAVDILDASAIIVIVIPLLLVLRWFLRKRRVISTEPVIELERLAHCTSCGSLIPEGVRKCAFCGAWQRELTNP